MHQAGDKASQKEDKMRAIRNYSRTSYTNGYKTIYRLFDYGDTCKVEKWVYGPDGYYRPDLSADDTSPSASLIKWIKYG